MRLLKTEYSIMLRENSYTSLIASLLTWLFCFSKLPASDLRRACAFRDKNGKGCKPDWRDAPSGKSYLPSYNVAPGSYT